MIERLSLDTELSLERLGGKACGLVRLLKAGAQVPDAWCLPATVAEAEVEAEILALSAELERIHPEARFAVRSSATAEDLEDASFAGVYATLLGVATGCDLIDAVGRCRASLHTGSARAYRAARGIGDDVAMAVVIQRMVEPRCAGVALTANPLRAFADEMVVDCAYGLGEGVVSGRTDPDHLVLERSTGEVREERIGEKRIALRVARADEPDEYEVAPELRARRALDDRDLEALWRVARKLEGALGRRLDLEWAFEGETLHLLQARPITGLPPERPSEVWSRKFGDEYLAGYVTPASDTFLVRWIREYSFTDTARQLGRRDLLTMQPLRRHRGYLYISGRYVAAGMSALPRGSRDSGLRGWFTPIWKVEVARVPFRPMQLLRSLLLPLRDPRGPMGKNAAALEQHAQRLRREVLPSLAVGCGALSDEALGTRLDEVDELGYDHFRIIRWGMGQYAPSLHTTLQGLLESWADDAQGELYQHLVSGLSGTHTAEINRDVWRLGQLARGDEALRRRIAAGDPLETLRAEESPVFWRAFDDFLARHGHRSNARELSEPRWNETPELVFGFVRAQLGSSEPAPNPATLERNAATRREEAERSVLQRQGRGFGAALRRRILTWVWRRAQTFTVYRENQRYYLDYILASLRDLLREHGVRLTKRGFLADRDEVFLLEADELRELMAMRDPPDDLRERLDLRAAHHHKWKDRLPATFLFDDVETEGEIAEGEPNDASAARDVAGIGAARGVARGRVRVLRRAEELADVRPGDLLVVENIDPGWTNVFPLIAGLVCETGGLLSHGALLAREYGIPAVMGVAGATSRLENGALLEIDGVKGSVVRVEPGAEAGSVIGA